MELYLESQKEILKSRGFVLIPGLKYYDLLLHFGASIEDLEKLETGSIHQRLARDLEAAMSFRQIAGHRLLLDKEDNSSGFPLSQCPFPYSSSSLVGTSEEQDECIIGRQQKACTKISCAHRQTLSQIAKEEICDDSGSNISIKRNGNRVTNFPPVEYIESTVSEAMAKLHDYFQPSLHHYQSNINQKSKTTINDQLLIRINKENDMAEPTPEGIHQDGTEISSITLISRKNVLKGKGGESRLWKVEQPTGKYDSDEFGELQNHASNAKPNGFSWDNCLFDKVLETPGKLFCLMIGRLSMKQGGFSEMKMKVLATVM